MNELIPISQGDISGEQVRTVNARELWKFLDVGRKFADWITDRINKYNFVENQDFVVFPENGNNPESVSGRPRKDYHITIDMAKELSMVQNNDKGKEARLYFIQKEKEANLTIDDLLNDKQFTLRLLQESIQKDAQIALYTKQKTDRNKLRSVSSVNHRQTPMDSIVDSLTTIHSVWQFAFS